MKKKMAIIVPCVIIVLVLAVLFLPFKMVNYDDGGTTEYRALTYKIVKWNRITIRVDDSGNHTQETLKKTAVYWLSDSAKSIDELWQMETGAVPTDFEFSLTWGCYGISSYNSRTGKLVKTTDATTPEDYVTEYKLTEQDRKYIYGLISSLDISSYPDEYDPGNGMSKPSMTLILSVTQNGKMKTVEAKNISLSFTSDNKKGQAFLSVCRDISDRLAETEAWQALPDYEFYYD